MEEYKLLKCEVDDTKEFKNLFIGVSKIVDEIRLNVNDTGILFSALDKSHINFIQAHLDLELFTTYSLTEPFQVIIDTEQLSNILKRIGNNDKLTIAANEANLNLIIEGDEKTTRTFNINGVSKDYKEAEPPELEYATNITLPLKVLIEAVKDVHIVEEKILFKVDPDYFYYNSEGMFNSITGKFIHGEHVEKTVDSLYALENVKKLIGLNISEDVKLFMGQDMPLTAQFDNGYGLKVMMLIAPRIEA